MFQILIDLSLEPLNNKWLSLYLTSKKDLTQLSWDGERVSILLINGGNKIFISLFHEPITISPFDNKN